MTLAGRQFRKQSGVGLIEVILVIAIAGFMIAIAINGISNSGRGNFDDGMNQVLNNLRQVQNEAASGQGPLSGGTGDELIGKGVAFAPTSSNFSTFWVIRPASSLDVVSNSPGVDKWPSSVKLAGVTTTDSPGVSLDKAVLIFTKGAHSASSSAAGSAALPYLFAQDYVPGVINALTNYETPQTKVVTLSFVGASNPSYKASVEVNTATGTMELKK